VIHIIRRLVAASSTWGLPIKLLVSGLGVVGGAGSLGFVSEWATYTFALNFGFRPPLEGIPYLRATVALGSLLLLMSGAAVFSLVVLLLQLLPWAFRVALTSIGRWLERAGRERMAKTAFEQSKGLALSKIGLRGWKLALFIMAAQILAVLLSAPIFWFSSRVFGLDGESTRALWIVYAFSAFVGLAVSFVRADPRSRWWFAAAAVIAVYSFALATLFSPRHYAGILRTIGYGGGLSVVLEHAESRESGIDDVSAGFMLLRTTEAVFLLRTDRCRIVEIPLGAIRSIGHDATRLNRLPYALPDLLRDGSNNRSGCGGESSRSPPNRNAASQLSE
jgi:hypothetical protein